MSGYVWEVTSSTDAKWRVCTKGPVIEEAVKEFRRLFDDEVVVFKISYLFKLGIDEKGEETDDSKKFNS